MKSKKKVQIQVEDDFPILKLNELQVFEVDKLNGTLIKSKSVKEYVSSIDVGTK